MVSFKLRGTPNPHIVVTEGFAPLDKQEMEVEVIPQKNCTVWALPAPAHRMRFSAPFCWTEGNTLPVTGTRIAEGLTPERATELSLALSAAWEKAYRP